nr:type II secretion system protein [Deinococcus marmoris]
MKNNTEGFTLIELLIVIAIIGILAAVLIPNLLGAQKRAYDTGAQGCAKSLQTAQAAWQIDKQTYGILGNTTTTLNAKTDGVATNCKDANMSVVATTGVTFSGSEYSFDVGDIRGSKTFRVNPSSLKAVPSTAAPTDAAPVTAGP